MNYLYMAMCKAKKPYSFKSEQGKQFSGTSYYAVFALHDSSDPSLFVRYEVKKVTSDVFELLDIGDIFSSMFYDDKGRVAHVAE